MFEIYVFQENTTGWLSETIPRDLDEKTFIQVRCFCFKLEIKIKFYTIKSYKEQTRVRFNNIELYCSGPLGHETLAVSLNLHCYFM